MERKTQQQKSQTIEPLILSGLCWNRHLMKKALRQTQTLRAGCSKAEPKNFAPPQTPSRGRRTAKI